MTKPPVPAATWYQDLDSIRKAAATVRTLEASFVQTRTLKILKKPLLSRGIIAYRRPNDLRWEYQSPLATVMIRGNFALIIFIASLKYQMTAAPHVEKS